MEVVTKLKDVLPCPWNTRGEIKPESVKELADCILSQGLINPITIWKDGDGRWICIAGNRRLAAMRQVFDAETEIEGLCTEFHGTEDEAKLVTVTENFQRIDVGPIEEAALVGECIDGGMTAEEIAAKTGRSVSWVNRRKRLLALDDAWKTRTDLTADCLERIAAFSPEIQKKVAKNAPRVTLWRDMAYYFDRESSDLSTAKFCTTACTACLKRTGVEADLFGYAEGNLGRCLDAKCFKAKVAAWRTELIAAATKGASEVVTYEHEYQMPRDVETSPKRTKAHPCAYVCITYNGEVKVRWGESLAAKEAKRKAEEAKRKAERAETDAKAARVRAIADKLHDYFNDDANEDAISTMVREAVSRNDERALDYAVGKTVSEVCGWHDGEDWAEILNAFDEAANLAGVDEADAEYLMGEYGEGEEDDDE